MAANPFMMDEPSTTHGSINPFAMPVTSAPASAISNPFFDVAPAVSANSAATSNPFLMDEIATEAEPAMGSVYNPFAPVASCTEEMNQAPVSDGLDWLTSGGAMQLHDTAVSPYDLPHGGDPVHHGEIDDLLDVDVALPDELVETGNAENPTPSPQPSPVPMGKPARPAPPPRPPSRPSPPHETQQLILSVTGAMAATSEHLLDRLRATAPSPVPGYIPPTPHTPSPSPSPCPSPTPHVDMDLLVDDGSDSISAPAPALLPTSRPSSPAVPPRPAQPPSRPGPPSRPPAPAAHPSPTKAVPPPRPSAPHAAHAPVADATPRGFAGIFGGPAPASELEAFAFAAAVELHQQQHEEPAEEIDLLGLPKPRTRTKNDILKLYEKKDEKDLLAGDVLFDSYSNAFLVDLEQQPSAAVPMAPEAPVSSSGPEAPAASIFDQQDVTAEPIDLAFPATVPAALPAPVTQPAAVDLVDGEADQLAQQQAPALVFPEIKSPEKSEPIAIPGAGTEAFGAPAAQHEDAFDAFSSRFEKVGREDYLVVEGDPFDPFSAGGSTKANSAWGTATGTPESASLFGFGQSDGFDSFLALTEPPPAPHGSPRIPSSIHPQLSHDSDEEEPEFALSIKPRSEGFVDGQLGFVVAPTLAPPPKLALQPIASEFAQPGPNLNPFLMPEETPATSIYEPYVPPPRKVAPRTDSEDSPTTPLFDEDQSVPLEVFPRIQYNGQIWEMQLRQPNKKKITSQRFWKKVFVKLGLTNDLPVIQLYSNKDDKEPFQELQLQPCYSVSDISAQHFDQYGKIFTVKVQYVFYKERPGIRPGQVTKAERLTSRLQQFAAYAIQGDYNGVKEFGSDLRKLGIPVEHAPHISELLKLGSTSYEEMKEFSSAIEEALFKLTVPRAQSQMGYKTDEVQMTAVDEFYVEQDKCGRVLRQIARVRVFFLGFLSGLPDVELGVNDLPRQGKEVVGRHDIIPVITEEWIRLEDVEFHGCVDKAEFDNSRTVKFRPPDACYIELLRFRVRPPKNRELPLQVRTQWVVSGTKIELRSDVLVPGYISRKYGQIPCEDVAIRFPIPEAWIYMFRVEKHFRYGSVKSSHRRMGKIKGIERFLGTVETMEPSLIEVTSGSAKYEHHHRSIVWRMPRLPKEGQGSYTTHNFVCRINLTSFDLMPEQLAAKCYVEFTMPATNVSHTTLRSLAVSTGEPPEKYVRYLARHEYVVEIEHTSGPGPAAYVAATVTDTPQQPLAPTTEQPEASDSDSD